MLVAIDAYLLFVGLAVGSFVNLAADRLPRRESLVRPPSHCTACGRRLNLVDLVPVLGYALRGGRCATCRTPIGISSPVVEAASGMLMLGPFLLLAGWQGVVAGVILTAAFGAGVTGAAVMRGARSGLRPDARSAPPRLAR